jgi:predicted O-methyltransferase YrrM
MHRVREEVKNLYNNFDKLNCIETGTIRTFTEKHESTRHISEVLGDRGHLKSLDIEPKHIEISKKIVGDVDNVEWIECDSIDYLRSDKDHYNFVFLDSVNDPNHIMEEFKLVAKRVYVGGAIMIDDAGTDMQGNYTPNPNQQHQARKGWGVWDWCKANEVEAEVVMGGHSTQILIPVTENNAKLFEELL